MQNNVGAATSSAGASNNGNSSKSGSNGGCCCSCSGTATTEVTAVPGGGAAGDNKKRKPILPDNSGSSKSQATTSSSSSSSSQSLPSRGVNNSNPGPSSSSSSSTATASAMCRYGDYMPAPSSSSSSRHGMPGGSSGSSMMNCKKCYYMRFQSGASFDKHNHYKAMWPSSHHHNSSSASPNGMNGPPNPGCDFDPRMRHQSHHHHNHPVEGYSGHGSVPYPPGMSGMGSSAAGGPMYHHGDNHNHHGHHHHQVASSGMSRNGSYGGSVPQAGPSSSVAIPPHVPTAAPPPPPPYPMCNNAPNSHWHSHMLPGQACPVENCNMSARGSGLVSGQLMHSGRYPVPVPPPCGPGGDMRNKTGPQPPPKRCNCPDNCHNEHNTLMGPLPGPSNGDRNPSGIPPPGGSSSRIPVPVPPPTIAGPSGDRRMGRRCNCVDNCPQESHGDVPPPLNPAVSVPGPSRALDLPGGPSAGALVPMVGPPMCHDHQKTPQCCIKSYCCKLPYGGGGGGAHKMHPKMLPPGHHGGPSSMMAANCRTCYMMEAQYMNSGSSGTKCDCRYHASTAGGSGMSSGRYNNGHNHPAYPHSHHNSMARHDPMFMAVTSRSSSGSGAPTPGSLAPPPPPPPMNPAMPPIPGVDSQHGREELAGRSHGCSHAKCQGGAAGNSSTSFGKPMMNESLAQQNPPFSLYGNNNSVNSSPVLEPLLEDVVPNRKPNCVNNCLDCSIGCEVEFPLDAVACIFDCLTEACIISDRSQRDGSDLNRLASFEGLAGAGAAAAAAAAGGGVNGNAEGRVAAAGNNNNNHAEDPVNNSIMPPQYQHIYVTNTKDKLETYLTLAFQAAVLALGKQRIMPQGLYSQHVVCKQQDQLIARLTHIDLDLFLVSVLKHSTIQMLDGGPTSGFGVTIHPESVPMHTLARFLFTSLLNYYPDLAFQAGLRAMRLPVLEEPNEDRIPQNGHPQQQQMEGNHHNHHHLNHQQGQNNNNNNNAANGGENNENRRYGFVLSRYSRWWTLGHLETQQCSLSSAMLSAAKGEPSRLAGVLESARRNIHSSSHLFKVSGG